MSLEDIALTSYISKVKKIPILEDNEEYVLAKRWRENHDKKALDKLISSHLRLVVKIAKGYGNIAADINFPHMRYGGSNQKCRNIFITRGP